MKKRDLGIRLDIGCGDNKQPHWVGMDRRKCDGVDIVHDAQKIPYPLKANSCFQVLMSHLWEHIEPKYRIDVMDELWRIIKPEGQLLISVPYYQSAGACQDPTHYTCPTEATFTYFDKRFPLYNVYKCKPWKLIRNTYQFNGNMEVVLEPDKDSKKRKKAKK